MPDRTPYPGMREIKALYQYSACELADVDSTNGSIKVKITNMHDFISSNIYDMYWSIICDGKTTAEGTMSVPSVEPKKSRQITINAALPPAALFGVYLNLSFRLAKSTLWAKKGFEAASAQLEITVPKIQVIRIEKSLPPVAMHQQGEYTIIEGDTFTYKFNNFYGSFESITRNGVEFLRNRPCFSVWRAPTDNDRNIKHQWNNENLQHVVSKVYSVNTEMAAEGVRITVHGSLCAVARAPFAQTVITYTILPSGEIMVNVSADIRDNMMFLPRFGLELIMPAGNEYLEYYGLGPEENYCDMNSIFMGLYTSSVSDQYFPYIKPQEHGNHGNVKWAAVFDMLGRGLLFRAKTHFEFNASHYTAGDLTKAAHTNELEAREETIVRIDYKNGGIGSGSCGPYTFDKYLVNDKQIRYTFGILPFSREEMAASEAVKYMFV